MNKLSKRPLVMSIKRLASNLLRLCPPLDVRMFRRRAFSNSIANGDVDVLDDDDGRLRLSLVRRVFKTQRLNNTQKLYRHKSL